MTLDPATAYGAKWPRTFHSDGRVDDDATLTVRRLSRNGQYIAVVHTGWDRLWLTGDGWRVPPCRKPPASQFPTIAAALAAVAETGDVE